MFLVLLMLFLATQSDDEVEAKAEPTDNAAEGADADDNDSGKDDGNSGDDAKRGDRKPGERGAKPRPRPRRLDPLRAPPGRGSKMVPSPDSSVRVRRIQ